MLTEHRMGLHAWMDQESRRRIELFPNSIGRSSKVPRRCQCVMKKGLNPAPDSVNPEGAAKGNHGQVRNVCYNLGETHSPKDQRLDCSQLRLLKGRLEPSRRLAPSVISLARGTQLPRRGHRLIKYRRGAKKRVGNAYTYRFGAGQRRQSWQSSGTWR